MIKTATINNIQNNNQNYSDNELLWSAQQQNITSSVYAESYYGMPDQFGSSTAIPQSWSIYASYTPAVMQDVTLSGNPYLYTGQAYEFETGLYYYHARFYSPYIGRFLQTDPAGYDAGMNWYSYCGNDPISYSDPIGNWRITVSIPRDCITDTPSGSDLNDVRNFFNRTGYLDILLRNNVDVLNSTFDGTYYQCTIGDFANEQIQAPINIVISKINIFPIVLVKTNTGYSFGLLDDRTLEKIIKSSVHSVNLWSNSSYWAINLWKHLGDFISKCDTPFHFYANQSSWFYKGSIYSSDEVNYILEGHAMAHLGIPRSVGEWLVKQWKSWRYDKVPSSGTWYWWNKGYDEYKQRKSY
jgi:RHS repeat-associated protein